MAGRISPQAKNLLDAITGIGVPRKEVSVSTESKVYPRDENGYRYREYGHAHASLRTPAARKAVEEHAQHLADRGVHVTQVKWKGCGHVGHTMLGSEYNPEHKVREMPIEGTCLNCRRAAGEA